MYKYAQEFKGKHGYNEKQKWKIWKNREMKSEISEMKNSLVGLKD